MHVTILATARSRACGDQIHVWRAPLDRSADELLLLMELLSEDERARAARFYFERDRRRFVAARGLLRIILSRYTQSCPGQLVFGYTEYGKPFLTEDACPASHLSFNVSHSEELMICAVASGLAVGVDVERVRAGFNVLDLAQSCFSPRERAMLAHVAEPVRRRAFFHCWTRKEAYIKAIGQGLSLPLQRFDVSLTPGEDARVLEDRADPDATRQWCMWNLDVGPEYAAAVVVERGAHLAYKRLVDARI